MQTCIALRTMLVKDGVAYLQAGVSLSDFPALAAWTRANDLSQGGIVFDSDPYDEWMETINKLGELLVLFRDVGGCRRRAGLTDGWDRREHALHHVGRGEAPG